jgi:galactokinase/mevalonate kinase-like predicted kinase
MGLELIELESWDAPGRCGIIGNPSDSYGGATVSCSLPVRNRCTVIESEEELSDATLLRAVASRVNIPSGLSVRWSCDVPRSSGLAGSTALLAATLACFSPPTSFPEFAEEVRDIEAHEAGVACGWQDSTMVVHGGLNLIRYTGKRPDRPYGPHPTIEPFTAELPFLLITTGVPRVSGSVHGPLQQRWLSGEKLVTESMLELAEMADAARENLLTQNYPALGRQMTRNQEITRALGASGDVIETLIADCLKHGAIAAKLAGAGHGGTVIALVESPDDLERKLRTGGYKTFIRPMISPGLRQVT